MREITEKQAEFLSSATDILEKRATEPDYQHWIVGEDHDESVSYCWECIHPDIGPSVEQSGGGYGQESDHVELCGCCGTLLEYSLTDYGAMEELFHFEETPDSFDWDDADQCYELSCVANHIDGNPDQKRILIGVLLKGKNFPGELKRIRTLRGHQAA